MAMIKLSEENPDMNVTDAMVRDFLVSSQRHLNSATAPGTPEVDFRNSAIMALLSGLVAYLLAELKDLDQGTAADVAWQVHDFCEHGEPLADWVAEELTRRGVDVEAMIREQHGELAAVTAETPATKEVDHER